MSLSLLLSSVLASTLSLAPSEFTTTVLDLNDTDTLHITFALPYGFFSFTNDSGLFINVATACDALDSADCVWTHATASGVYFMSSPAIIEILPRESVHLTLAVGYRSDCPSIFPSMPGDFPFRDGDICYVPSPYQLTTQSLLPPRRHSLFVGEFSPGRIARRGPHAYSMRAQKGRLTRGLYALQPGDYVDVIFANPFGFVIVSDPAGFFYANVGSGCSAPSDARCVWYHSAAPRAYILAGSQAAVAQIVAVTAGLFQITVGYFDRLCCEMIDARANQSITVGWEVPPGSVACFVHTIRTGTMAVNRVVLGDYQVIHGYDFHSLHKSVAVSATNAIGEGDGIGALLFDNRNGKGLYVFSADVRLSDPEDTRFDLGFVPLDKALRFKNPTELVGEQYGFADRPLDPGGCIGVNCASGRSEEAGNTAGIPMTSDGDPVYESDSGPENSSLALAIAISILILIVGTGLFVACSCWRKSAMHAEDGGRETLASDEELEPGGAYNLPENEEIEEAPTVDVETSVYGGASMVYAADPEPEGIEPSNIWRTSGHGVWCL
jgi:hypothetical protein